MRRCQHDPTHALPKDANPRRLFCSTTCRVAAHRAGHRAAEVRFRAEAASLLHRQTAAVLAGDAAGLAEIARQAERLFGPTT
jgi:hypothetical protein